ICLSSSSFATGCTAQGAKVSVSTTGWKPPVRFSAAQCASSPSPRQETRPTPVIIASRGLAMQERLRNGDPFRGRQHLGTRRLFGEGDARVGDLGVGPLLAGGAYAAGDDSVAGAVVQQAPVDLQRLAGDYEGPQLRLLPLGQERHALELQHRQYQP